jgi:hypothetical protein
MPALDRNHSNFLNGTIRTHRIESPISISNFDRDLSAPGEGRIQPLSELINILKRVKAPSVAMAEAQGQEESDTQG